MICVFAVYIFIMRLKKAIKILIIKQDEEWRRLLYKYVCVCT